MTNGKITIPYKFKAFPNVSLYVEWESKGMGSTIYPMNDYVLLEVKTYATNIGTTDVDLKAISTYSYYGKSKYTSDGYSVADDNNESVSSGVLKAGETRMVNSRTFNKTLTISKLLDIKAAGYENRLHFTFIEYKNHENINYSSIGEIDIDYNTRGSVILTAQNFNDEENPFITYSTRDNQANPKLTYSYQAAISFDGKTAHIPYRSITKDGVYTFNLTSAERQTLINNSLDKNVKPIYYLVKTSIAEYPTWELISKVERTLTITGAEPFLNPTVKDISEAALALTGSEDIFIKYISTAEYSIGAVSSKGATIVSQSIQNGDKVKTNLPVGIIDNVESGLFTFNATDSRGLKANTITLQKRLIEYVKPTCSQKASIELDGETGAKVILDITGHFFNGSFGAVDNELKLEVRHTQSDGTMGDWVELSALMPELNGNTYSISVNITGLEYSRAYTFQCRASDKLRFAESAQYTVRLTPSFDWGENDFNFNIPVNINADSISMNGEQIIRHNATVGNIVLSATGGHIYLRPSGTNDTSNEARFSANGNLELKGDIIVNGVNIITALRQKGIIT